MKTTALKTSATYGGPAVFGVGAAMLAAALIGTGPAQPAAQAPPPAASSSPSAGTSTPSVRESSPDPRPRPSAVPVVVVAGRDAAGSSGRTAGGRRASSNSSSGGTSDGPRPTARPSPTSAPPVSGVSVSLRRPLGLLPDVDLTIGGNSR